MIHQSPSRITMIMDSGATIMLVDIGGDLLALPTIDTSQDMLEANGIFQRAAFFRPLGGARVVITFEVRDPLPYDHAVAQADWLAAERAGAVELLEERGSLIFETAAQILSYAPAVIASIRPGLPFGPESVRSRRYEIHAAVQAP